MKKIRIIDFVLSQIKVNGNSVPGAFKQYPQLRTLTQDCISHPQVSHLQAAAQALAYLCEDEKEGYNGFEDAIFGVLDYLDFNRISFDISKQFVTEMKSAFQDRQDWRGILKVLQAHMKKSEW